MKPKSVEGVPMPSLVEAFEARFQFWAETHRIIDNLGIETAGNGQESGPLEGTDPGKEPFRFVAGRKHYDEGVAYILSGDRLSDHRHFSFEVAPDGSITERTASDPYVSEDFRRWIRQDLKDKLDAAAKQKAERLVVTKMGLTSMFGAKSSTVDAEEFHRVLAISG